MDDGKISVAARRLWLVVATMLALSVILHVVARVTPTTGQFRVISHIRGVGVIAGLASDLASLFFAVALWRLMQMLAEIAGGDYFSLAVVERFRGFALFLLLSALSATLLPLLISIGAHRGKGEGVLLTLDFRDGWTLCIAAVLFLLARLIDEARRIEHDLREIV